MNAPESFERLGLWWRHSQRPGGGIGSSDNTILNIQMALGAKRDQTQFKSARRAE
jgi:hypothetical protein